MGLGIERDDLCHWLWLKAVQPVKEIDEYSQCILLFHLHRVAKTCPSPFHIGVIFESEVPLLERDGVAEEELWAAVEDVGDGTPGEVEMKRA